MKRFRYFLIVALTAIVTGFYLVSCGDDNDDSNGVGVQNTVISGDGTLENPFNSVAAIKEAKKLASGEVSQQGYYIK